jgi:CelD/BcsL family acetyltransferase involved in cellulose biosynthesis
LTELPQILTYPDPKRRVLRQILRLVTEESDGWDWVEVSLTPEQGWIEPEWLWQDGDRKERAVIHQGTRTGVVLPLPSSWDELRHSLKRNIKESIRRGRNRLARVGHDWEMVVPGNASHASQALDDLMDLHHRRAQLRGKVHHPDYLADPADEAFLHEMGERMFATGHCTPSVLKVGSVPVAARLLLHANQTTFFSVSGLDPAWWEYSVGTTLMAECLKAAMARGDTLAHLSLWPNLAKHRWSELLEFHNDFILLTQRRRSHLAFRLYWKLRTARQS